MKWTERGLQLIILLTFIYYSQFYKLGTLSYRIWDEARLATSAYEMSKTGNLLVTTVGYKPDMWNTKPPLMIWAQAICIKIHGINEFSTRFPSALCASFTIFLVALFVFSLTKNSWAALAAATVLCTAKGYIGYHGTRHGEYDGMLALFTTAYIISFFLYIQEKRQHIKNRYLRLFFFALIMATLAKGIAALLFSPILFLYVIIRKQLIPTLSNPQFYIGAASFLFFILGYYFLREHYNPGYLEAILDNELGGRFLSESEGHSGSFSFYYNNLVLERFRNSLWIVPTGLFLLAIKATRKTSKALFYFLFSAILFLTILSFSKTKLPWYDLPVFPLFAIIIGLTVYQLTSITFFLFPSFSRKIISILLFIICCSLPIYDAYNMIRYSGDNLEESSFYAASYYMRDAFLKNRNLNHVTYFSHEYNWQWLLYVDQLNEKGIGIRRETYNGLNNFHDGQQIIAHQEQTKKYIESNYAYFVKEDFFGCKLYEITSPLK